MTQNQYKIFLGLFIFIFYFSTLLANAENIFKTGKNKKIEIDIPKLSIHTPWAKPLKSGKIKILAIAPLFASLDFLELEKRLDCNIQLLTTQDAFHLGCDPLWGQWCPDEERRETLAKNIKNELEKKWDLLLIAGIDLNVLPKDIYQNIIQKIEAGRALLLIPLTSTISSSHPLLDLIDTLDTNDEPTLKWLHLFSGEDEEIANYAKTITIKSADYGKGRLTCINNYLNNVYNHALLPDKVVKEKTAYIENAWAGLISLILWTSKVEQNVKIINITDAKPSGPTEEEIPPELPMMVIRNLNQSLLGPGTYPFYIEIDKTGKERFDHIKIQIRRENDNFYFQQYDFRYSLTQKGKSFVQIEIPIGDGTFFMDAWLMKKNTIIDFFTKKFNFNSWPKILNIETDKKIVFPNDTLNLKIQLSSHVLENREGTIVAQAIEDGTNPLLPEGALISEAIQYVAGNQQEVSIPIRFSDIKGNYIKVSVWGIPFKINSLENNYSNFFSNKYIVLPIQRKIISKEWKNFIVVENINEYNQNLYSKIYEDFFNCGIYVPLNELKEANPAILSQPVIIKVAEESVPHAISKNRRDPCINDTSYIERTKAQLTQTVNTMAIPTPQAFSLGTNNCLVQSEEIVCYCDNCIDKYLNLYENMNKDEELMNYLAGKENEEIRDYLLNQKYPSIVLTTYQKFMSESFLSFENELKNSLKLIFPDIPIGYRFFPGKEPIVGNNWFSTLYSMDWLAFDADPLSFALMSLEKKQKLFWVSIDFSDSFLTPEKLTWDYWNAILNQANGIWFLAPFGTIYNAPPIKMLDEKSQIKQNLTNLYYTITKTEKGINNFIRNLTPDSEREIGIYYTTENLYYTSFSSDSNYEISAKNFLRLLNGAGYNPIIVTRESLPSMKELRILILPCFYYLTDSDKLLLSEFTKKGTIIVDVIPEMEEHKNFMYNEISTEKLVILGESLSKNIETEPEQKIIKIINLIKEIIKEEGIKSKFLSEKDWIDGKFYSFDNSRVVAWIPNLNPIQLNDECLLKHDLFQGKEIFDVIKNDKIKKVKINIYQNEPLIVSSNPYRIETIEIVTPSIIHPGNRIPIKIQLMAKKKDSDYLKHWVQIELRTNLSAEKALSSSFIQTNNKGVGETYIPTPLNQPSGWYYITAHEITTGVENKQLVKFEK